MPVICCPVCQSRDVYQVAGGYIGQVYRCKACGYRGSFILVIDPSVNDGTAEKKGNGDS